MSKLEYKYFVWKTLRKVVPEKLLCRISHYKMHKRFGSHTYWLNLDKPKTFNEKITWLKLNHRFKEGNKIADKIKVREYVKEIIGDDHIIPVHSIYAKAEDIDFDKLPPKCVLKPNHGSGWVIFVDKEKVDDDKKREIRNKLSIWLKIDVSILLGEWQYSGIERKIICEEFIQEIQDVIDYKFYCFNGEPKFVQLDIDRHQDHTRLFKDLNWNNLDYELKYRKSTKEMARPDNFGEMVSVSRKLSKDSVFCRTDLYSVKEKILFGEITLHPEAGNAPFKNYNQDLEIGRMLKLPIDR